MQNVLLQMNLNLLSPNLQRVKEVKTFILRCHGTHPTLHTLPLTLSACFTQVRDLAKQFCPRCGGGATLTRVSCSTNARGEFRLHLKPNMQWNNRGNRFNVPKPVAGAANPQRVKGGGKGGWGNGLILTEDQKEFSRQIVEGKRQKRLDVMDPDYLPSILSGDKGRVIGRPKVGAGRTVNSRKR
jgi:RNA-binding protein NOB1